LTRMLGVPLARSCHGGVKQMSLLSRSSRPANMLRPARCIGWETHFCGDAAGQQILCYAGRDDDRKYSELPKEGGQVALVPKEGFV
jgi:hypothetical protein